jgi:Na+-transporting NADH:ubiquinone oxidoreductase subunit NqrF
MSELIIAVGLFTLIVLMMVSLIMFAKARPNPMTACPILSRSLSWSCPPGKRSTLNDCFYLDHFEQLAQEHENFTFTLAMDLPRTTGTARPVLFMWCCTTIT